LRWSRHAQPQLLHPIQFVLFEPVERVKGNEEVKVRAGSLLSMLSEQLKTLKTKKSDW
jgi:hypothetical protein